MIWYEPFLVSCLVICFGTITVFLMRKLKEFSVCREQRWNQYRLFKIWNKSNTTDPIADISCLYREKSRLRSININVYARNSICFVIIYWIHLINLLKKIYQLLDSSILQPFKHKSILDNFINTFEKPLHNKIKPFFERWCAKAK